MTVEALYQANSGTFNGRSTGGASGSVAGQSAYISTSARTSGRLQTTLGRFVSPPHRHGFLRTNPGLAGWVVFGITAAIFGWACITNMPATWGAALIPGIVALWVSKTRRYFASKAPHERRLAIWREFLVCVPCNIAFLSARSTGQLGLAVPGWRVSVDGLHVAVTRLATKGR
ncbi:hypothetical protein ACFWD7_14280 [Streptomyces mirabilis]|uniref:hypothetical protein n=1 Tax=Streptomyces mirabilis TaxID=68239 RepID=UPI0021C0F4E0|nr:hypothetical protein [Streptomyces mirabilis]MCT9109455.1 hypothetical protein [Streptomyces mirabilis]